MRIPLSWLRDYVDVPEAATVDDVLASLVSVGFEEEDVHRFEVTGPVVVGRVLSYEEESHSNGKTVRWCQVDVGEAAGGVRGIVCGARNFSPGDQVVVALPGSVLPGPFPISARRTYGHVSDGMIASARELGIGEDHSGILRLAEWGVQAAEGDDAIALLGLDDVAAEVNVTPDRGYALSMRGIAREYSHATGAVFRDPGIPASGALAQPTGFPLAIEDSAPIRGRPGASLVVLRVVRGVDPARPTPPWMVARLRLAGMRSLGILVDITNYVMLELGNPIHGYDLARVHGGIVVRRAHPGESLTTLDGQVRRLHPEDLVIADDTGAIGLAGVMGGASTEMSADTRDVLVEAAVFDPASIARTARRHKLPSEASRRFERGVDPAVSAVAAERVVDLMTRYAGGRPDPLGAVTGAPEVLAPIRLSPGFVPALIGVDYTPDQIRGALETIGCSVSDAGNAWQVQPPTWRPDLVDSWSLAEEVARITGYDRIPSVLPDPPPGHGWTALQRGRRRVANALAAAGYVETPSFPFVSPDENARFGSPSGGPVPSVMLANPLDSHAPALRRSLIPGMLQVAHRNAARGLTDLALFEIGEVFLPEAGVVYGTADVPAPAERPDRAALDRLDAAIPPQRRYVAVLVTGASAPRRPGSAAQPAGLPDVRAAVEVIAAAAGRRVGVRQTQGSALHPGRAGVVAVDGVDVGYLGELHPDVTAAADLPGRVTVAEVDLDLLLSLPGGPVAASAISDYPAATQDVSLVVPAAIPAAEAEAAFRDGAGPLLESIRLVDDYRGPGVPDGSKSLTFALRFRAPDRTLTAAEATEAKLAGVSEAAARVGAAVRE
jgi:phenylalanyl-tRNA synthetase beta chain